MIFADSHFIKAVVSQPSANAAAQNIITVIIAKKRKYSMYCFSFFPPLSAKSALNAENIKNAGIISSIPGSIDAVTRIPFHPKKRTSAAAVKPMIKPLRIRAAAIKTTPILKNPEKNIIKRYIMFSLSAD